MGRRRPRRSRDDRGEPAPSRPAAVPRPFWRLLTREDLRDHPAQVAFIVLFLLASLVAPPVAFAISTARLVRATTEVEGTFVSAEKNLKGRRKYWIYTYEYRVDGAPYRRDVGWHSPPSGPVAPIRLLVDPSAPHRSYRERNLMSFALTLTFLSWGVAALLDFRRRVPSGLDLLRPRYAWAIALVFTPVSFAVPPLATPPEMWWLIPLRYLAVLAVTSFWLLVRWKRR